MCSWPTSNPQCPNRVRFPALSREMSVIVLTRSEEIQFLGLAKLDLTPGLILAPGRS